MERRKSKRSCNDELALVKAAAWAWFQHGSGSDSEQVIAEFDIIRTCHAPYKPSRYKLEAMKSDKEGMQYEGLKSSSVVTSTCENSLLDTYEIESISRKLDQLIELSGDKDKLCKGFLVGDVLDTKKAERGGRDSNSHLERGDKCPLPLKLQVPSLTGGVGGQEIASLIDGNTNGRKKKNKKFRGFWTFWYRHPICGTSEDVLNTKAFVVSCRRQEKGVYVPRPRATKAL